MRLMFALAILLCATVSYSQQPPADNKTPSSEGAQPPATNQGDAENIPLTITIIPGKKSETEAADEQRERNEKAANDKQLTAETQRIADFTFWLSAFTLFLVFVAIGQAGLFVWQLFYMREGLKDAKTAADAAQKSSEMIPNIERAYVFIAPIFNGREPGWVNFEYTLLNHGKTPAIIKSMEVRTGYFQSGPDNTTHSPTETVDGGHVITASGSWGPRPKRIEYTNKDFKALEAREIYIWLYGSILYDDVFGKEHTTSFRWRIKDWKKGRFHAEGGEPFNKRT